MPEYLAPGVYVEEIDTGSKPIEGVSTSTAAMAGFTERGPVDVPILLTSYGDFTRWYGGKLPAADYPEHYHLPYAVEGFFTNGGKRLYLTRVIDTAGAAYAAGAMHDRGTPGGADTFILRAAGELTGTLASLPLLYALDVSAIAVGETLRVGDGSSSEYRTVVTVGTPANNTHVPLSAPLNLSHPAGGGNNVEQIARAVSAAIGAFTLDQSASAADTSIQVTGAAADITALVGLANPLLEIGAVASAEYRIVSAAAQLTATTARLTLQGGGLALPYSAGTPVIVLDTSGAVLQASQLTPAAAAGDRVIYVDTRNGNLDTPGDLIIIDRATAARTEVRRIGELGTLEISTGAYEEYAAGSVLEHVTLADDDRSLANAVAAAATTLNLTGDTTQFLGPGTQLLIGLGPTQEVVTVSAVDRTVAPHVVTVSAFVNGHAAADTVVPRFALNAASTAGSRVMALANRVGLAVGDIVRIGDAPDDEFAAIEALPSRSASGADPGTVLLTHPLTHVHASGTLVRRQNVGAGAGQATFLALDLAMGGARLLATHGTGYSAGEFIRITTFTGERFFHRLSAGFAASAPAEIEIDRPLSAAHIAGSALVERNPLLEVRALDLGLWGNRLRISVADEQPGIISRTTLTSVIDPQHIRLASAAGVEAGTVLELLDPADDAVTGDPLKVEAIDRSNFVIALRAPGLSAAQQAAQVAAIGAGTRLGVRSREFRIEIRLLNRLDPARPSRNDQVIDSEIFRYLSMDPRHSRYAPRIIGDPAAPLRRADRRPEGESSYIRITDIDPTEDTRVGPEALIDILPTGQRRPARHPLDRGDDSLATLTDSVYIGADNVNPELKTGLWSLTNVDEISILAVPGRTGNTIQSELIAQCENLRYRVAVLDGPAPNNDSIPDVQILRQRYDSKYAALYYPWLLIDEPFPVNLQSIGTLALPPSGHMMGIYARTDIERGVHKAPANEVVRGVTGLCRIVNHAQQEILNPYPSNINVIRDFRPNNRSIRVWGGRILTSDPDWKYVNVRRLMIFIERSIDLGLQWVVFEPNAEPLWARVRRTISNFLTTLWRSGALEGTKREEAYFVTCDRTTMTQTDIDNGRLICVIGVAPVKPAEFVIIRIGLWTAHAED